VSKVMVIISVTGGYPYAVGVTATLIGYARCSTDEQGFHRAARQADDRTLRTADMFVRYLRNHRRTDCSGHPRLSQRSWLLVRSSRL
jgi:hypothetical protein